MDVPLLNGGRQILLAWTEKFLQVSLQRIDVPGHGRSVIRADTGERSVHIVVREDTTEVRGVGTEAGGGSRWASAGLLASVGKQEVDTLLSRIMLV